MIEGAGVVPGTAATLLLTWGNGKGSSTNEDSTVTPVNADVTFRSVLVAGLGGRVVFIRATEKRNKIQRNESIENVNKKECLKCSTRSKRRNRHLHYMNQRDISVHLPHHWNDTWRESGVSKIGQEEGVVCGRGRVTQVGGHNNVEVRPKRFCRTKRPHPINQWTIHYHQFTSILLKRLITGSGQS